MLSDLSGKGVLVTGASTGIGAAVARGFARQGAAVAIHYNRSEAEARAVADAITAEGGRAVLVQGDLTASAEAKRVVDEAARALGRLDVLVNNAGGLVRREPFETASDALLDEVVDLNIRSLAACTQAAIPHLDASGGGAVINIGSIAGNMAGGPGAQYYGAAKAFVHNLTRFLARELAGKNIRVNAVAPGVIRTPFHAATPPERMEAMRQTVPQGRIGEPEDCVGAVLFLASPAMSAYVTGQVLHVNGGQFMPS